MRGNRDALMVVKSELFDRLDRLQRASESASRADFEQRLEGIISLAGAYGLRPVARLGEALRQSGGPPTLYFERMRDAIRCERSDEAAAQAMIASVSVRLGA